MNVKINSESNDTQQQTVSFSDQNQQWTYAIDNQFDSAHRTVDTDDADLNNFFSRPIKIASINWTVGSTFGTTLNPWQLYFENLRVINRISNFNVLRSKLCVRIMINGNGFHYGRALASYRPLHTYDGMVPWRYGLVNQDIIAASQRMHVWIDPTKSQGGTLCLPFVYYKNAMNVPEQDWREMGELDIASITDLRHANGGTDSVTLSVFAWAEDVSLSIPTVSEPGALAPQSFLEEHANETDLASKGPISGPAAAVAKVAGSLAKIPMISKMALATEMAATATGSVARLFGMSRPVDSGPIQSYKPTYVGNMANSNVLDTSTKLTFDVKQELTIDPVATGLGPSDEMAINSIASRESYLTQFAWSTSDVPERLLWNCYVTPSLFDTVTPAANQEYHYTPVGYVSRPFENWRGTLKYRFQVVASSFHKGRIKVVYDPYFNSTTEYNTQSTHIIDLANERDFTVEIGWGQEYSYLDHADNGSQGPPFDTSLLSGARHGEVNGVIAVYVVNDLTTPSSELSDVSILVSVSAGDDFEVCNPNSDSISTVEFWPPPSPPRDAGGRWEPQADLSSGDEDLTTQETKPMATPIDHLHGVDVTCSDDAQKIYFGDPVTSLRQIMKRYGSTRSYVNIAVAGEEGFRITMRLPNFPFYRGYDPNGIDLVTTPVDPTEYNFMRTTPLHYFTPLFLCRRGGIRVKYMYTSPTSGSKMMAVTRVAEPGTSSFSSGVVRTINAESASKASAAAFNNTVTDCWSGAHVTHVDQNPVLEVELPFQSNLRFAPARKKSVMEVGSPFSHNHTVRYPCGDVAGATQLLQFVSVGEDFSLSFFQACPVFWVEDTKAPA